MNFCSVCGNRLTVRVPPGDARPRFMCDHCGAIHYENPKIVVGSIPVWGDQILLCRRAIEPRRGYWTLPAGFLENNETVQEGALRETAEEAGARIELASLFTMLDVIHVHQVHMFFRARLIDLDFEAGEESLEVRLFEERDIPWSEIAFRTVTTTLEHFLTDRARGEFTLHTGAIRWVPQGAPTSAPSSPSLSP